MLIDARAVTLTRNGATVLTDVNFAMNRGEIVTVVGPNGSGKSTLIQALVGAIAPSKGTITRAENLRIGYVPQSLALASTMPMTVARFLGLPGRRPAADAQHVLARVGLSGVAQKDMSALSGGERQRVMLARALRGSPDILVLDEPTSGLDQPGTAAFYKLIQDLRHTEGIAVLLVSHDLHVVMAASDRVICLNGHICCEGRPEVVSSAPEYRALFGHGTGGALALYRHDHDHDHDHDHSHQSHNVD